jgi:hypothetical protein
LRRCRKLQRSKKKQIYYSAPVPRRRIMDKRIIDVICTEHICKIIRRFYRCRIVLFDPQQSANVLMQGNVVNLLFIFTFTFKIKGTPKNYITLVFSSSKFGTKIRFEIYAIHIYSSTFMEPGRKFLNLKHSSFYKPDVASS